MGRNSDSVDHREAYSVVRNFGCRIAFSLILQLLLVRTKGPLMLDTTARERAETLFDRTQKRERELEDALKRKRPVCRADLSPIGRGASAGRQQSTRRPTAVTWAIPGRLAR